MTHCHHLNQGRSVRGNVCWSVAEWHWVSSTAYISVRHTAHYQFLLQTIDLLTAPPPSPCLAILHSGGSAGDNITLSFTSAALTSRPLFTTNIEIAAILVSSRMSHSYVLLVNINNILVQRYNELLLQGRGVALLCQWGSSPPPTSPCRPCEKTTRPSPAPSPSLPGN